MGIGFDSESFPEKGKRISIHRDGGGLVNFFVLANSKLTGFTAVSYFFTLIRDEPKKAAGVRVPCGFFLAGDEAGGQAAVR